MSKISLHSKIASLNFITSSNRQEAAVSIVEHFRFLPNFNPGLTMSKNTSIPNTNTSSLDFLGSKIKRDTPVTVIEQKHFPANLPRDLGIILDQTGKAFAVMRDTGNPYALAVGGRPLNNIIRQVAANANITLSKTMLNDINENLQAHAEMLGIVTPTWRRVAPVSDGIEIDLGDEGHTRIRITANQVLAVTSESETLFFRPQFSSPMTMPSEHGNLMLLKKYVNLGHLEFVIFCSWLSYTLAHPKVPTSKYVILAILGGQGTGKSVLSRIIKTLIDPSVIGVQILPTNIKDLSIAAQHSHVLCYDNLRQLSHSTADALCVAATGGSMSSRQLYSDSDQQVLQLHVALVLNGIHAFIDQPDLAQRCLPLHLEPFKSDGRKSEAEIQQELAIDMPAIQRGLFDLIAHNFANISSVNVTNPERMIDFCKWLGASEKTNGIPEGALQNEYTVALNQGQRDALNDNLLAAIVLEFGESLTYKWSGTPTELLGKLSSLLPRTMQYSREWPDNPIALSKQLQSLQAGLSTQGIRLEFRRGKERTILIHKETAQ